MEALTLNNEICKHQYKLEKFALKFTNDIEDANDLVQDTFVKAIRYHNHYKEGTNLCAWLFTIMRNTFINNYRSGVRKRSVVETCEDLSSAQLTQCASGNLGEGKFVMADVHKALCQLPDDYKIPFLKYFEGFKYHEIADELNIPIGTVKTRIFMARQQLKNKLKMYNLDGSFKAMAS